jgi:ribosome recycling factor
MSIDGEVKATMQEAVEHVKKELKSLRSSRANPGMLDNVMVEIYGTKMKIRDLANVTVPESRQLLITPYDANNAAAISKGIEIANLSIQPQVDGNVIRINIPPMDESVRKDIAKQCKEKCEKGKVTIRDIRRKYNDVVKKQKTTGDITEDEVKSFEKVIQTHTDKFCEEIDIIGKEKEKEIMEI